jgi:hypothetical protein
MLPATTIGKSTPYKEIKGTLLPREQRAFLCLLGGSAVYIEKCFNLTPPPLQPLERGCGGEVKVEEDVDGDVICGAQCCFCC